MLGALRETGGEVGGESSGHILLLDKTTTGDAMMAALQVLAVMRETGQSLAELAAGMDRFPQTMINVKGVDKRLVGQVAANLRAIKPPDVYKQKGVRYVGEVLRKKEGKTGK